MKRYFVKTNSRWQKYLLSLIVCVSWGMISCANDETVIIPPDGWTFEVFAEGIEMVDNLVFDEQGVLYVSQEIILGGGNVLFIKDGEITELITDLNRSDGLAISGNNLYVTEEVINGRVIEFNLGNKEQRVVAKLNRPEGIDILPSGDLIIVEDALNGRLVKVSLTGEIEELAKSFKRLEGVCTGKAGAIFMTETDTGRVLIFSEGNVNVLIENINNPDQIECLNDVLWITEDVCPGRLLTYQNGQLSVFAEGLCSPQGITFDKDGSVYVSEQGQNRILKFTRL